MASPTQQSGHQQASTPIFPEVPLVGDPLWIAWAQNMNDFLAAVTKTFNMPGLVTNVTATANSLVTLVQWTATNDATMYRIYRNTSGDFDSAQIVDTVAASKTGVASLTYQDGADQTTATRFYWVSGVNERGIEGPKSAMVSATNFFTAADTGTAVGVDADADGFSVAVGTDSAASSYCVAVGYQADSTTGGLVGAQSYGYQAAAAFNHEVVFGSATLEGAVNLFGYIGQFGSRLRLNLFEEIVTIAAAATTDTSVQFPANSIVLAGSVRVTVTIPTAATFTVTLATAGTQLDVAGGVSTAAGTTDVGTANCPTRSTSTQSIRITPNLVPANNNGRVRVTFHYYEITPATS